ncbi:MAG: alpha-amylase [Actinomycetales bacterium]|nr:alpha-amylase [Actinomycetales bacterium]
MTRPLLPIALAALALGALTACDEEEQPRSDVGVQLFMFPWTSIAEQCETTLGPAGYGWVLTSPPQEHITGEEWWIHYQPVSHQVESRLGTREEFAAMVDTCHAAGVDVIADAVVNHMAGIAGGKGWAGTEFTQYEYPGLFTEADFHRCTESPSGDIEDYQDADEVQNCELVNLADLDTGSESVRATLRAYLEDLVSLGVDGFRIDAAKHMAPEDVAAIVSGLPEDTWVVQEVIRGPGEPIQPEQYLENGSVFEFSWGRDIEGIVGGSSWSAFDTMGSTILYAPPDLAVPFVTNHDTERNGTTMTYRDGAAYQLATVLTILHEYGSPMVYAGYAFSDRDAGPVLEPDGTVAGATCIDGWEPASDGEFVCAHTWPLVNAAVRFAAVVGESPGVVRSWEGDVVTLAPVDQSGRTVAFAAVNRGEEAATGTWQTELEPGTYCDLAAGPDCVVTVEVADDGSAALEVPALGAVILTIADRP